MVESDFLNAISWASWEGHVHVPWNFLTSPIGLRLFVLCLRVIFKHVIHLANNFVDSKAMQGVDGDLLLLVLDVFEAVLVAFLLLHEV